MVPNDVPNWVPNCVPDWEGDSAGCRPAGGEPCAQLAPCASTKVTSTIRAAPLSRKSPSQNSGCPTTNAFGFDEWLSATCCSQGKFLRPAPIILVGKARKGNCYGYRFGNRRPLLTAGVVSGARGG